MSSRWLCIFTVGLLRLKHGVEAVERGHAHTVTRTHRSIIRSETASFATAASTGLLPQHGTQHVDSADVGSHPAMPRSVDGAPLKSRVGSLESSVNELLSRTNSLEHELLGGSSDLLVGEAAAGSKPDVGSDTQALHSRQSWQQLLQQAPAAAAAVTTAAPVAAGVGTAAPLVGSAAGVTTIAPAGAVTTAAPAGAVTTTAATTTAAPATEEYDFQSVLILVAVMLILCICIYLWTDRSPTPTPGQTARRHSFSQRRSMREVVKDNNVGGGGGSDASSHASTPGGRTSSYADRRSRTAPPPALGSVVGEATQATRASKSRYGSRSQSSSQAKESGDTSPPPAAAAARQSAAAGGGGSGGSATPPGEGAVSSYQARRQQRSQLQVTKAPGEDDGALSVGSAMP